MLHGVRLCRAVCALLLGIALQAVAATPQAEQAIRSGERIYREGVLPLDRPVRATVEGDVAIAGRQAACVNCHGRSGLGSSEGNKAVPPITGLHLARSEEEVRKEFYQPAPDNLQRRPAYTDESLRRAIRTGIDPKGRRLDSLMPRYDLRDDELDLLIGYLQSLSPTDSPGVTTTEIHLATVVTEDADPEKRRAMLEVLATFQQDKNAATRNQRKRAERAPWDMEWHYKSYRDWVIHVWKLKGPPGTWKAQLAQRYDEQPVFAMVSGIAAAGWRPIHEFCEERRVPCVLPNTDLPPVEESDFYSIYFSKGLVLEAAALAKHLRDEVEPADQRRIIQVYRDSARGLTAARTLRTSLTADHLATMEDRPLPPDYVITPGFWRGLLESGRPPLLILWLTDADLAALAVLRDSPTTPTRIYLSSSLLDDPAAAASNALKEKIYFTHPFALPAQADRLLARTKAWFAAKDIPFTEPRVQGNTYLALTVTGEALKHIGGNFSREYFIERIEHMMENMVTTSVYPYLSLAPGQRFASKGCFIARPANGSEGLIAASGWIVPQGAAPPTGHR